MPGRQNEEAPWFGIDEDGAVIQVSPYERLILAYLRKIADALEEANRLNAPAAEINAFNLKQLKAATEGGILSTPGQLIRK